MMLSQLMPIYFRNISFLLSENSLMMPAYVLFAFLTLRARLHCLSQKPLEPVIQFYTFRIYVFYVLCFCTFAPLYNFELAVAFSCLFLMFIVMEMFLLMEHMLGKLPLHIGTIPRYIDSLCTAFSGCCTNHTWAQWEHRISAI